MCKSVHRCVEISRSVIDAHVRVLRGIERGLEMVRCF